MPLTDFVEKWTSADYPPDRVAAPDLSAAEECLAVQLPDDYRQAILSIGLPRPTIALLSAIVDQELALQGIGDFFSPSEMIEETLAWRELGLPQDFVTFASDGAGNKFCFHPADGPAVWFFDHDFGTVEHLAPSFTEWIGGYCGIAA